MTKKDSYICEGCNKIVFGKPKHKITIFTLYENKPMLRIYCSDECLEKTEDFTI